MIKKTALVVTLLLFVTSNFLANQKITKLPKGVSIHLLDNGLKVLLIENPALPMIGVNTVVKVGSAYETFATSGMSHMLEHLLFNGTSKMTQRELYDLTDKIGGYNNANTSEYYTNFMMVTPSENIVEGMKIQAGMLFDSILPQDNFEKEKGIILEEIAKSLADSKEQLYRNSIDILYEGHALSLPTLGTYETIKNINRDYVYNFYKNNFVPNNMLMSVIGNFKADEMLEQIKSVYGIIQPGIVSNTASDNWSIGFEQPKTDERRMISHRFYKGEKTQLQHFYIVEKQSSEFFSLLNLALENEKDELENSIREKFSDIIESVSFTIHNFPIASFVEVNLTINNEEKINAISDYLNMQLKKMEFSLSEEFINHEAVKVKSEFLKQIEKPHMFGIYNANLIVQNGLDAIIEQFSGNGIVEAGKELNGYRIKSEPQIIIQHPLKKENNDSNINVKTELFEIGKLNAVVIAKQNNASQLLAIHYLFKYKAEFESKYRNDVAKKWHDAFGDRMNSEENQKKAAKYGLSFVVNDNPFIPMDNIYLSPTFGYIRVEGLANDIEVAISFLNEQMLNFIPTEEEFNKVNKSSGGMHSMMGGKDKSQQIYDTAYESLVLEPVVETRDIKILNYNKFLEFGKEYFTPNNIIISVVSNEKPETVNGCFANFKSVSENELSGLAKERGIKKWEESKKIEKEAGGEQSHTFYGFVKTIDKSDEAALTILSLILSDDISFNIREKQGLAYRMSSGIKIVNDKALFYVDVPTQPQNVEKLLPQFSGLFNPEFVISKTELDIEKTVNMYLGKMMFRRLSSINQAYYLAYSYYYNGKITSDDESLAEIKNVKLEDVKRVANKYMQIENPVEIIIY